MRICDKCASTKSKPYRIEIAIPHDNSYDLQVDLCDSCRNTVKIGIERLTGKKLEKIPDLN